MTSPATNSDKNWENRGQDESHGINNNNNTTATSHNKKVKTAPLLEEAHAAEFQQVREYVAACSVVAPHHPAIVAALEAIDQAWKRHQRDAKLQAKFMWVEKPAPVVAADRPLSLREPEVTPRLALSHPSHDIDDNTMTDDWHEVARDHPNSGHTDTTTDQNNITMEESGWIHPSSDIDAQEVTTKFSATNSASLSTTHDPDHDPSFLGQSLAQEAIRTMAQHQVRIRSSVAALALALHAALVSDTLGFACTGLPDETEISTQNNHRETNKMGFAAPIRELPKTQFLPTSWDQNPSTVSLRYRKNGVGLLVLRVQTAPSSDGTQPVQEEGQVEVQVSLAPPINTTNNVMERPTFLTFSLEEHWNLSSFRRAQTSAATTTTTCAVEPALHYKALSQLMTRFARSFDLGSVQDQALVASNLPEKTSTLGATIPPYVDRTIVGTSTAPTVGNLPSWSPAPFVDLPHRPLDQDQQQVPWHGQDGTAPRLETAFPGLRSPQDMWGPLRGDFAGDLAPGGFGGLDPGMGGMLMGPHHPRFTTGGGDGSSSLVAPGRSGLGMMPRYDPVYPPGGPTEPDGPGGPPGGRRSLPSTGSGNPNPDHLPPPRHNQNMFS